MKRSAKTLPHEPAMLMNGRAAADSEYPKMTMGFRRRQRSESLPEMIFRTLLTASAAPSMTPSDTAVAPRTVVRKNGSSG